MSRGLSLYLDAARALAALAVLVSHLGYASVTAHGLGWARAYNIGSDAVIVFFVLSGLLIAHTARAKDRDLRSYAAARLSRLWSVALPAVVFSAVLCAAGWAFAPAAYAMFDPAGVAAASARAVVFTNYLWTAGAHLPANNPFWSVTYEFWYYVAFGAAVFLRGRARLWALAAAALAMGPRVLLLAPCWSAGADRRRARGGAAAARLDRAAAWSLTLAPVAAYAAAQALGLPAVLTAATAALAGGADPNLVFGFSDEFVWNWIIAALTAAHFFGVAGLARGGRPAPARLAAGVRWVAGRTFSLYLFHMPILQLVTALPGYDAADPRHPAALAAVILAVSFGLAEITERKLGWWRARLDALLAGVRPFAAVPVRRPESAAP